MLPALRICWNLQRLALPNVQRIVVNRGLAATAEASKKDKLETESESQPRYMHGRRIIEEVEDPYTYEHVLLTVTGYDAAILDSFSKFVQTAAKMTDVDVTKSFNMAAIVESMTVKKADSQLRKDQMHYKLKKHQRMIEVSNVTEDRLDIFVDYVQENLPCGVQIKFELKRWEELIAPGHPSLQNTEKVVSRYQKK